MQIVRVNTPISRILKVTPWYKLRFRLSCWNSSRRQRCISFNNGMVWLVFFTEKPIKFNWAHYCKTCDERPELFKENLCIHCWVSPYNAICKAKPIIGLLNFDLTNIVYYNGNYKEEQYEKNV